MLFLLLHKNHSNQGHLIFVCKGNSIVKWSSGFNIFLFSFLLVFLSSLLLFMYFSLVSLIRRVGKIFKWFMYKTFVRVHLLFAILRNINFKYLGSSTLHELSPTMMRMIKLCMHVWKGVCMQWCVCKLVKCIQKDKSLMSNFLKLLFVPQL